MIDAINAIDPKAADWLATLIASADQFKNENTKPGFRGVMVGKFDQHEIDEESRHLLCLAVSGHESSKDMDPRYWPAIAYWLDDGGAALVPAIVSAIRKAQGQAELPGIDPVVSDAVNNLGAKIRQEGATEMQQDNKNVTVTSPDGLPHLKTVAVNYERKFNLGNYNSATIGFTAWADIAEEDDLDAATAAMWEYAKEQVKAQALPIIKDEKTPPQPAGNAPPQEKKSEPPSTPAPPKAPSTSTAPPQQPNGDGKSGTAPLKKITVDADGKVEFHVGNFRWPFKDGRGGEVVAGLFDAALGWKPEHFAPGAKYEDEVQGLVVDWAKPGKYYDVVRVYAA